MENFIFCAVLITVIAWEILILAAAESIYRISRSYMFFKIGVLKNFAMFTGKHPCESLFLLKL